MPKVADKEYIVWGYYGSDWYELSITTSWKVAQKTLELYDKNEPNYRHKITERDA